MARVNGLIKIEGTVEDLTFYKKEGVSYVRRKGGVSKERINSDSNFVRTRENNNEFGHSGTSGKILRRALGSMALKAKDSKLSSRLLAVMSQIKNMDTVSARGERKVSIGLSTPEGKQALRGFNFNAKSTLSGVLMAPYTLDTTTGTITIPNLLTAEQILFPQGATHVSFQSSVLMLDFETENSEMFYSPSINLPLNMTASSVLLSPSQMPTGSGQQFFMLMISFYQQVNGVQYSLKNEEYNVLCILDVI
ncbi:MULTISPECIES: hypothetical protein [Flavobacterium]|uniref:Uncharacterized protein n=1 Tax=Flavobacterium hankyongi TaxID=1176532 RepID=A0ABP9A9Z8_9FLAO|nr:hypothetical protein [Flavobacterium sp. N1846]